METANEDPARGGIEKSIYATGNCISRGGLEKNTLKVLDLKAEIALLKDDNDRKVNILVNVNLKDLEYLRKYNFVLKQDIVKPIDQKFRIRETLTPSMCADNSTNTIDQL